MQSKAFDKSVKSAPKYFPLSTADFHFSSMNKRQYRMLYPLQKPHSCFEKKGSMKLEICLKRNCSNIFDIFGNMLTGL